MKVKKRWLPLAIVLTVMLGCVLSACQAREDTRKNRIGAGLPATEPLQAGDEWQPIAESEELSLFVRTDSGDF